MPPKSSDALVAARLERERLRSEVLKRHRLGFGYGKISKDLTQELGRNVSKSTVQSIVRQFKDRPSVVECAKKGRPTKMTPQYAREMLLYAYCLLLHTGIEGPCSGWQQSIHS